MTFAPLVDDADSVRFLTLEEVDAVHSDVLMDRNPSGWLKRPDLESALGRPEHHYAYGQRDLIALAAVLWHGISVSHGFQDGNKRTGLQAALIFLEANGIEADISVASDEPGLFVTRLFENGVFEIDRLDAYLRTRCHWIVDDDS